NESTLDLRVQLADGDIQVEVKSPYRETSSNIIHGDDSGLLADCLERANKQFAEGPKNLLFVVPRLQVPLSSLRNQLVRAFFGEFKFVTTIDTETGESFGPTRTEFFPEGHFLKFWTPEKPRFTRVGAVLCVEEDLQELPDNSMLV